MSRKSRGHAVNVINEAARYGSAQSVTIFDKTNGENRLVRVKKRGELYDLSLNSTSQQVAPKNGLSATEAIDTIAWFLE